MASSGSRAPGRTGRFRRGRTARAKAAAVAPDPALLRQAELRERLEGLRRFDAEEPDGRWFLPLAGCLRELGDLREALRTLRHGLARDPECLGGWVLLGECHLASGELVAARRVLSLVLSRDPENAHALRGVAAASARLDDRAEAVQSYRALLRLMPGDVAAQEALAELLDETTFTTAPAPPRASEVKIAGEALSPLVPPPAPRARRAGIFEPLPGENWSAGDPPRVRKPRAKTKRKAKRTSAERLSRLPSERSPKKPAELRASGASAPSSPGYRRWLERILGAPATEPGLGKLGEPSTELPPASDRDRGPEAGAE
jgi:tetratricopeptide (TPR) repeat protein